MFRNGRGLELWAGKSLILSWTTSEKGNIGRVETSVSQVGFFLKTVVEGGSGDRGRPPSTCITMGLIFISHLMNYVAKRGKQKICSYRRRHYDKSSYIICTKTLFSNFQRANVKAFQCPHNTAAQRGLYGKDSFLKGPLFPEGLLQLDMYTQTIHRLMEE